MNVVSIVMYWKAGVYDSYHHLNIKHVVINLDYTFKRLYVGAPFRCDYDTV